MFGYNLELLLLVIARMTGCVFFNPVFGRKNIPGLFRMGIAVALSVFSYGLLPAKEYDPGSALAFLISVMGQLLIGYAVGFVMQAFIAVLMVAGENMDMQMGVSMSKIYDPQSNISMPLTASMLNAMFLLVFFASGSHQTMLRIFARLAVALPYGGFPLKAEMFGELAGLLSLILLYAVKLSLPLMAAELIAEFGVGLIMRAVPQIDIFVINIQMKVVLGFFVLLMLVPAFSSFTGLLIEQMFDRIRQLF